MGDMHTKKFIRKMQILSSKGFFASINDFGYFRLKLSPTSNVTAQADNIQIFCSL